MEDVCANPDIGEAKLGDLAGIRVHKFKFQRQEYLMAYRPPRVEPRQSSGAIKPERIDFYQVGTHENFTTNSSAIYASRENHESRHDRPRTVRGPASTAGRRTRKVLLLLESQAFPEVDLTHEQVFGHLAGELFTVQEAAEYLEMSVPNFRRYVRHGQIAPTPDRGTQPDVRDPSVEGAQARAEPSGSKENHADYSQRRGVT